MSSSLERHILNKDILQISLRLLFVAIVVSALDAAFGKYLLESRMLTFSVHGICNAGLFVHAIVIQAAVVALIGSLERRKQTLARILVFGTVVGVVSFILSYQYSESLARWLWRWLWDQNRSNGKWVATEITASLTPLLGIPLFCAIAALITATIWRGIRTKFLQGNYTYD